MLTVNGLDTPGTMTEDEVAELVALDANRINRLRVMYQMFELNSRDLATYKQTNKRRKTEETPKEGIDKATMKAIKDHNIMPFVNEFKYQLYVTSVSRQGEVAYLGPFCSPSQVQMVAGGIRPQVALKKALVTATLMFKTKQSG